MYQKGISRVMIHFSLWLFGIALVNITWMQPVFAEDRNIDTTSLLQNMVDSASEKVKEQTQDLVGYAKELFTTQEKSENPDNLESIVTFQQFQNSAYDIASDGRIYWVPSRKVDFITSCKLCLDFHRVDHGENRIEIARKLDLEKLQGFNGHAPYLADGQYVIYQDRVIFEADSNNSFDPREYAFTGRLNRYLILDHLVFYDDQLLPLNGKSLQVLADDFVKDDQLVFKRDQRLEDADAETFEVINSFLIQDKNNVWRNHRDIELTDIKPTLQRITCQGIAADCHYVKNHESIYYQDQRIESADLATFEVIPLSCIETEIDLYSDSNTHSTTHLNGVSNTDLYINNIDNTNRLDKSEPMCLSVSGYPYLQCSTAPVHYQQDFKHEWARDREHVYYQGVLIPNLDPTDSIIIYLNNDFVFIDRNRIAFKAGRETVEYQEFLAGPLPQDGVSSTRFLLLADEAGFFQLSNIAGRLKRENPGDLCDYNNGQPTGLLRAMTPSSEEVAYAFEDDRFEYYIKAQTEAKTEIIQTLRYSSRKHRLKIADILAIKDYIIDKQSGEKYVMFNYFIDSCGKWQDVKVFRD